MPISTTLMLAILTALRLLCFAIAVLFLLLAIRAQYDAGVAVSWFQATLGGAAFLVTGIAAGMMRAALAKRTGRN